MTEMNGVYCSTRPMRISAATPKKTTSAYAAPAAPVPKPVYPVPAYTAPVVQVQPPEYDVNNTAVSLLYYIEDGPNLCFFLCVCVCDFHLIIL